MHVEIEHTGAWMPFGACHDDAAGDRPASWVIDNWRDSFNGRVVITPQKTGNSIDDPELLAELADGAPWVSPRTDHEARGGPVVAAWPSPTACDVLREHYKAA